MASSNKAQPDDARGYRMVAATLMVIMITFGAVQLLGWVRV
jgi:hypothetical protein